METGDRNTSEVEVALFAGFCGAVGEELHRLLELAQRIDDNHWLHVRGDRLPDELRSVIVLEATAQIIAYYEPIVIPGLVQTEDYARALFHERGLLPADVIESRVRTRMDRQRLLRRRNHPGFSFLIHENALRMPVGNARIMHEQLLHLLLVCAVPPHQVRVVPASIGSGIGPSTQPSRGNSLQGSQASTTESELTTSSCQIRVCPSARGQRRRWWSG